MKVVHYIPSIDVAAGGVSACLQEIVGALGSLVELHIITHRSANMLKMEHCTLHFIPCHRYQPWRDRQALEAVLDEVHPDIYHTNSCWEPLSSYGMLWAKCRGCKTLYTLHGMMAPLIMRRHYYTRKWPALMLYQQRALQQTDCVVATSQQECNDFLALGYNSSVAIIPNAIRLDGVAMRTSWASTHTILYLSRIHPVKGLEMLLEALTLIKNHLAGYRVIVAGGGEPHYITTLKAKATQMGVADKVDFVGEVCGARKWDLFRSADFFVLPTHTENFGMVIAEALAVGTPVITTQGAPWQCVEECGCGRWMSMGAENLALGLVEMMRKTSKERQAMGLRGRQMIEERFSANRVAERMYQQYKELLKEEKQ